MLSTNGSSVLAGIMSSKEEATPSHGPSSHAAQPSLQDLEDAPPGEWFPDPPPNYKFVNEIPKHLLTKNDDGPGQRSRRANTKPDTKEFYDSKNSVEQPPDGDQVKEEDEACLTCISQGGNCHGTSVKDGKCESCRGIGPDPGKLRQQRVCRWKQPTKGVYTYVKHQEVNGGVIIKRNTAAWKKANANEDDPDEAAASETEHDEIVLIWHFPYGGYPHALLRWLAALLVDNGMLTDDQNLDALIIITRARFRYARRNPQTFSSEQVQREVLQALNEIYWRLDDMKQNDMIIVEDDILEMVPDDHNAYVSP